MKLLFLGDSITQGVGASSVEKRYTDLVAKRLGCEMINYGISGTRIARQTVPVPWAAHVDALDFCTRYSEMDDDAQLVVVFGGTNDFGHGDAPIGEFTDRTPDTFYGACHTLMSGLLNKYPDARIIFMTPLHRISEDTPDVKGYVLKQYVEMIKEVAEYYSIPVLDLWSVSGLQPRVDVIKEKYVPDGLHPNDLGHEKMADVIGSYLASI